MKTRSLVTMLLIFLVFHLYGRETRFFLVGRYVGPGDPREVDGTIGLFAAFFNDELHKFYPCTVVTTEGDIGYLLGHERQRQLLGSGSQENLESISDALGCEYGNLPFQRSSKC